MNMVTTWKEKLLLHLFSLVIWFIIIYILLVLYKVNDNYAQFVNDIPKC